MVSFAADGIRVNAIAPGRIKTEISRGGRENPNSTVNTPPPKGGGFGLRLKAGSVGPLGRLVLVLSVSCWLPFSPPPLWAWPLPS
jgi:NAD(P)-dependent dehydrogenase (short-subunit alcohol dehydrogenase family)